MHSILAVVVLQPETTN